MKTVNDIILYINDLFFVKYLEEDVYKKIIRVRGVLVNEIGGLDSKKLASVLRILDNIHMSFIAQGFDDICIKAELIRNEIFQLVKEKRNIIKRN